MTTTPPPAGSPAAGGVAGTAWAVRAGRTTAAEVADEVVARAAGVAWLQVEAEALRAAAAALDRRTDRFALPLAGVPVAVEDGISTAGRGDEPVRRLRGAGGLIVGRTRTAEYGIGPDGSPGGRSTAAAVAGGLAGLGVGLDGDGALRAAAAAHGLAALKPGRRVLPLPATAERRWSGLAETTVVGSGPDDLATALDALSTPRSPAAAPAAPAGPAPVQALGTLACSLRTGRTRHAGPDTATPVHTATRVLAAAGVRLVASDPPYRAALTVHGARRRHAGLARRVDELGLDPAELPRSARTGLRRGRRVRRLGGLRPATPATWRQQVLGWLDDAGADAALLPAPAGPGAAGDTGLAAWNLAGLPSLVTPVPGGSGPGCVQLVGRPGSEARLLATAALLAG
ncbi:hypothetical protein ACLFMI_10490 [Pseudonocardia nantongensis]|uniref:hypothetical protein n=1 Tax=Pseudonocardia nantongensis TaxID=1181885 RepID=UPI0039785E41